MFLEVSAAGESPVRDAAISSEMCVGGVHLQPTFWKAVTWWQRKTAGWHGSGERLITAQKDPMWWSAASVDDAGRCESKGGKGCSGSLLQLRAPSLQTHNPPITLLRYTYRRASPPSLLSQNTQKRGENQSPHKKSRWEYIIWSEKQFVLAIYCLCAKVISLSSSISAGSSYGVGGGHYTTWLQNLHRPLQRPGSLSERNPRWADWCQIMFWLRLDDKKKIPHPLSDGTLQELMSCRACIYAKRRRWSLRSAANIKLYVMYETSGYHRCSSSNRKCDCVWFRAAL